jgi:hypothetical protein
MSTYAVMSAGMCGETDDPDVAKTWLRNTTVPPGATLYVDADAFARRLRSALDGEITVDGEPVAYRLDTSPVDLLLREIDNVLGMPQAERVVQRIASLGDPQN